MPEHFKLLFESHVVIAFSFFFNLGNKLIIINNIISLRNYYKIIVWIKKTIVEKTIYI